jgi:hypothetical protein
MRHFCNTHPPDKTAQADSSSRQIKHIKKRRTAKSVRRNTHGRLAVASTSVTAR